MLRETNWSRFGKRIPTTTLESALTRFSSAHKSTQFGTQPRSLGLIGIPLRLGSSDLTQVVQAVDVLADLQCFLTQAWPQLAMLISVDEKCHDFKPWYHKHQWAVSRHEQVRRQSVLDAIVALLYGLELQDVVRMVQACSLPVGVVKTLSRQGARSLDPKGFWRVDTSWPPEVRRPILFLVAYADLLQLLKSCGSVRIAIKRFSGQSDGEGWQLPETLRLADYGLGHDERAKEHQPVRECFGPRWYDWQLAQSPEESWRECHLHARNQLGPHGYQALLDEIAGKETPEPPASTESDSASRVTEPPTPLFDRLD